MLFHQNIFPGFSNLCLGYIIEAHRIEDSDIFADKKKLKVKFEGAVRALDLDPSRLYNCLKKNDPEKLREFLTHSVSLSCQDAIQTQDEPRLTAVHEAFQFLIRTFVENESNSVTEEIWREWCSTRRVKRSKSFTMAPKEVRASASSIESDESLQSRQAETQFLKSKLINFFRRDSFIQMTGIVQEEMDENDQKAKDADKVADEILKSKIEEFSIKSNRKHVKQRRKSVLGTVEEKSLLTLDEVAILNRNLNHASTEFKGRRSSMKL